MCVVEPGLEDGSYKLLISSFVLRQTTLPPHTDFTLFTVSEKLVIF